MSIEDSVAATLKLKNIYTGAFAIAVGVSDFEFERARRCYEAGASFFCVDVAHGDSRYVYEFIAKLRKELPLCKVIGGNIVTSAAVTRMKNAGAHVCKCGIGAGAACSTRVVTGHGFPQLSAIQECSGHGLPIIADGGIREPGDAVKALAFGASMVMMGGAFSGCTETPGDVSQASGVYSKSYRGMASKEANLDFFGSMADWKTAEGVATMVPFKGEASGVLKHFIGGLNSGLTYSGCRSINELQKKAEFVFVSSSVVNENRPHILSRN
jgi:IMP dehydrogenase